ncbi:MAG: hypothetical protein ACK5XM_15445 [Betaproteobacteria bacterium]
MAERGILFSGPMVRALLNCTKSQTRRAVKITHRTPGLAACLETHGEEPKLRAAAWLCPYGQVGDRLWVRETWAVPHSCDHLKPSEIPTGTRVHYAADGALGGLLKRPSMFMPRWASRITLEITGVRVERLQDISEADAKAEGCSKPTPVCEDDDCSYRADYERLWESINGPGSWAANPWVWVLEFKQVPA